MNMISRPDFRRPLAPCLSILLLLSTSSLTAQLAGRSEKFLGCILKHNEYPSERFNNYFNQVTPENSGKWVSVEEERDVMDWEWLDSMYAFALRHGHPFKQHTFVWGIQQPEWITTLSPAEQKEEVEEWIAAFCARYPEADYIDPANEPIHQPPPYRTALGGNGETGWDWLLWCHRKAREYAPDAKLILNEFDVLKNENTLETYMEIARLLLDSGLVDALGCQGHWLEGTPVSRVKDHLDTLATLGLDIYISELDLSFGNDQRQLEKYQELFPVLWEHPAVKGITLWGYEEGRIWRENGYLVRNDGTERPAMTWLRRTYFADAGVPYAWISSPADGTFFRQEEDSVAVKVNVEQDGMPVRSVEFRDGDISLGADSTMPFYWTIKDTGMDRVYNVTANARSDSGSYLTAGVRFGFIGISTEMPWEEPFDLPDGTVRKEGTLSWNTLVETAGTYSVQGNRFVANNLDAHGYWTCVVDISQFDGVNLSLDVRAEGGLDEGQDYLKVDYIPDGGEPVSLFFGDALFNGGDPLTIRTAAPLQGEEVQLLIEAYNTGGSEIYSWDNIAFHPVVNALKFPERKAPLRIFPNPSDGEIRIRFDQPPPECTTLRILDLNGRILREYGMEGEQEFRRETGLPPGMYLVRSAGRDRNLTAKLVIQ